MMTSPIDVGVPEGYTLVETEFLFDLLAIYHTVHQLSDLYEEVTSNLRARQPHPAALVAEKPGALQLVNTQGQKTGAQMVLVGLAVPQSLVADMHDRYATLTHDERFFPLLKEHGLISDEEDDGEEE